MQESIESKRIRQLDYCIIIRAHALIIQNKKRVSLVFPNWEMYYNNTSDNFLYSADFSYLTEDKISQILIE